MHPERADRCLAAELHPSQNDTLVRNPCNTTKRNCTPNPNDERARSNTY
jgi:hypothetical protein